MKKLLTLLLALAMVLSLAACGGGDKPAENTGDSAPAGDNQDAASGDAAGDAEPDYASMTIDELKPLIQTVTDGTLTVATSPDFAPYEFYAIDDAGKPDLAGFDIALANYIAEFLGLKLEFTPIDFDGVLMEVQTKSADLGMAGLSPDPKSASRATRICSPTWSPPIKPSTRSAPRSAPFRWTWPRPTAPTRTSSSWPR